MFVVMAVLLFQRIFTLQIVQGEDKQQEFELKIKKERSIASTRGNIYDVDVYKRQVIRKSWLTWRANMTSNAQFI